MIRDKRVGFFMDTYYERFVKDRCCTKPMESSKCFASAHNRQ